MFGSKHYVPILKGKGGELASLKDIAEEVKDRMTPLLEVMPVPWDFENERPDKSLDEHLAPLADKILKNWGPARPLFIDAPWIPDEEVTATGKTAIEFVMDQAARVGLSAIPVMGLDRATKYQTAVRQTVQRDQRGVCFRLVADDFDDLMVLETCLDAIRKDIGVDLSHTDLLIDLSDIGAGQATALALAAQAMINSIPHVRDYRTLTIAASSFPPNLSGMKADSTTRVERAEWDLWLALNAKKKALHRIPTFGDYAVAHPDQAEDIDPRIIQMSAQLRYTTEVDYLVLKGKNVREHGFDQFKGLCRKLVARTEYSGRDFSWGDEYIHACANDEGGPGNATTWRRIGTTHHLTLVTRQIATLP